MKHKYAKNGLWALAMIVAFGLGWAMTKAALADGTLPANPQVQKDLRNILEVGLRAGTPHQKEFISLVVVRVEQNVLPLDLVLSTFQWARTKPSGQAVYFERALRLRAAQRGIDI